MGGESEGLLFVGDESEGLLFVDGESEGLLFAGDESEGMLLTDEDRTLLERWKSIYPRSSHSVSSDDSHSTLSVTDVLEEHTSLADSPCCCSVFPAAKQNNDEVLVHGLDGRGVNSHLLSSQVQPSLWPTRGSIVNSGCHIGTAVTSLMTGDVAASCLPQTKLQPCFTALLAQNNNNNVHCLSDPPAVLTALSLAECGLSRDRQEFDEMRPYNKEPEAGEILSVIPTTVPLFQNVSQAAVDTRLLQQNRLSTEAECVPVDWIYDRVQLQGADENVMGVVPDINSSQSFTDDATRTTLDDLRVITSRLMKSHMEDLTLDVTPRGSGAGYGVGVNCQQLLSSPFSSNLQLSASHTGHDGSVTSVLNFNLY